jgi:hypothetical protein
VTLLLDLPNELERRLEEEAARRGLPLAEYALQLLGVRTGTPDSAAPRTGAELLALWKREGLLGGEAEIEDPVTYARELRAQAERRSAG